MQMLAPGPGSLNNTKKMTIKASDTIEHQPTVWPVTQARVQPYHQGSGGTGVKGLLCTRLGNKGQTAEGF